MELQDKWNHFAATGRVSDYLDYRRTAGGEKQYTEQTGIRNKAGEQDGSRASRGDRDGAWRITH